MRKKTSIAFVIVMILCVVAGAIITIATEQPLLWIPVGIAAVFASFSLKSFVRQLP